MTLKNWFIVVASYCSIILGGWTSTQLTTDFSITTLNTRNSEIYRNYQEYSKRFPTDERGLIFSIRSKSKFDSREEFLVLDSLQRELEETKGVKSVVGITSVELAQRTLLGSKARLLLPLEDESRFDRYYAKLDLFSDVTPKFLSNDRTATRLFLKIDWDKIQLDDLRNKVNAYAFDEVYYMGKGVYSDEIKRSLESEIILLPLIAGGILLFFFFLWFRDLRSLIVVVSVLVINLSLLSFVFYLSDITIGLLTSTTPLLILVLSFSDIVHILYKFKRLKEGSFDERVQETMKPLRLPLWLTTLTTGVAFGLFFITGISEITEFAAVTCAGILLAYLTARFLLPLLLVLYRVPSFSKKSAFSVSAEQLIRLLKSRRTVAITAMTVLLLVVASVIVHFKINVSFHQTYGSDTRLGQTLRFSDTYFEGVRSVEVILKSKTGLNKSTVDKVNEIENELIENYGCRGVFSVNTAIKRLNRYNRFGKASQFLLPEKIDSTFVQDLVEYSQELGLANAMTRDQKLYRIIGRLPDIGSAEAYSRNQQLQAKLDQLQDENHHFFISGFSFIKDQSTTRITAFILLGISLSLLVAMIVIGSVFRSAKIGILSFFPNLLPVLFGLAMMYWMGIELNPTTAMALSIILGLALDDTIYFLSTIKRNNHLKSADNIELSLRENTFPAAVTSLILMIGFGVLILSSIESNRNIGILVATMLFIALFSDLIFLPALLRSFWNKRN